MCCGVLDLCACVCKDCTSFLYLSSKCATSHVSSSPEPGGREEGRVGEGTIMKRRRV